MENKSIIKLIQPVIIAFVCICIAIFACKSLLVKNHFDIAVLGWGNLLLFAVTAFSFVLYKRGLTHQSTQGFLRNVYSALFLKLMVCLIVAFAYIATAGGDINKPSLFACMGLYLIYTFFEMRSVLQLSKQPKKNV